MDALREKIEATLSAYPVCEYAFVKPKELPFRDEVRYICRTECPRYGTSWSCPPAVGTSGGMPETGASDMKTY